MKPCQHSWLYPWSAPIDGDPMRVVRRCYFCREKQMADVVNWRKATGDYALEEHYADVETTHATE